MRARHRHFNARDAGADLVLDARFIDQADNTAVSAWPDRSANNHTIEQTASGSRPTFKLAQMNGNPAVQFDGSDDFLNGGDILDILSNNLTMLCVAKRTSGAGGALCGKSRADAQSGRYSLLRASNALNAIFTDGAARTVAVADTSTSPRIYTQAVGRAATNTLFFDGQQQGQNAALSGTTSYDTTNSFFVGAYQSAAGSTPPLSGLYHNGDIAQVVVFFSFNTPLRKRLEHAAAYSFKIACN